MSGLAMEAIAAMLYDLGIAVGFGYSCRDDTFTLLVQDECGRRTTVIASRQEMNLGQAAHDIVIQRVCDSLAAIDKVVP